MINEQIRDKEVRVISENGEQLGVMSAKDALKMAKEAAKKVGLEVIEASVSNSNEIQQVVASLEGKVDAIYAPTDNTIAAGMTTVGSVATAAGIPTFAGEAGMTEAGGVATYALDYYNLGKMTAKQAVRVLVDGEDISKMPIEYASGDNLKYAVNKAIADELNITIPDSILKNATIYE